MSVASRITAASLLAALVSGVVAQDKLAAPPRSVAGPAQNTSQDLEPSVDTSASANDTGSHPARVPRAPSAVGHSPKPAAPALVGSSDGKPKGNPKDRIELDTTQITGNRELPKVLYIVPWKHSDLSDLAGRPANSLLDEVLAPVDRDVFQRENRYYGALHPDEPRAGQAAAPAPAPASGRDAGNVPRAQDEK
jgi:hypothetical protein